MDDLISRNALLAGIEELKESPWFNFGKADPNKIRHEWMEGMMHYGYLQRKEAVEIIIDICIKKEPLIKVKASENLKKQIKQLKFSVKSENSDYLTGYLSALSVVESMIANEESLNNIKYGKRADYVHYDYDTIEETTEE